MLLGDQSFEIVDCAERGLRYLPAAGSIPEIGADIRGTVRFPSGQEVQVEGVVVRAVSEGIGVNFTELWIDKRIIERERRRLRGPEHYAR